MPEDRFSLGAPAAMSHLRSCRLLRRLSEPPRHQTFPRDGTSGYRRLRPARKLGLVLYRRDLPRSVRPRYAAARPDPTRLLTPNAGPEECNAPLASVAAAQRA